MSYNKSSINSIYLIHPPQPAKGDGQKNNSKKQKNYGGFKDFFDSANETLLESSDSEEETSKNK